jgi:hypothetical protein
MSLCLLSRGLQNCGLSKRGSCFQLSKAMIALLFDSALLRSTCSTSQPQQQKSLWRQLPPSPDPLAGRSIPQAATSRRGPNYPSTEDWDRRYLRHAAEASKKHRLSSSTSPDHPFDSANTIPADRLCLVCDAPRYVLFAIRISAVPIFTHALIVTTSIAAAVLTTTAPTATGPIPILLPN